MFPGKEEEEPDRRGQRPRNPLDVKEYGVGEKAHLGNRAVETEKAFWRDRRGRRCEGSQRLGLDQGS